eukprot:6497419-Heterocapsa_arctica.AAC.1
MHGQVGIVGAAMPSKFTFSMLAIAASEARCCRHRLPTQLIPMIDLSAQNQAEGPDDCSADCFGAAKCFPVRPSIVG